MGSAWHGDAHACVYSLYMEGGVVVLHGRHHCPMVTFDGTLMCCCFHLP